MTDEENIGEDRDEVLEKNSIQITNGKDNNWWYKVIDVVRQSSEDDTKKNS